MNLIYLYLRPIHPPRSSCSISFIRPHQFIPKNHGRKLLDTQPRRRRPRLLAHFLLDRIGEAIQPFLSWEFPVDILDGVFVDVFGKVAGIVEDGGKLNELRQQRNTTAFFDILMSNDAFGDGFGLRFWCARFSVWVVLEDIEGNATTVEFEGHDGR